MLSGQQAIEKRSKKNLNHSQLINDVAPINCNVY